MEGWMAEWMGGWVAGWGSSGRKEKEDGQVGR